MSESEGNDLQTILVATDGSPSAEDAIKFAVELAAEHRSELLVVHVVPTIDLVPPIAFDEAGIAVPHEPTQHDYALLDDAAACARAHGVDATTALLGGPTAAEIVAYSDSRNVDMIVVGSQGRGAVASALLGSVSRSVLRLSKRPVLIVHGARPHSTR